MKIEATGKHFAQTNHSLAEMKVQIIERVCPNLETCQRIKMDPRLQRKQQRLK
jgi:hypothetical protein